MENNWPERTLGDVIIINDATYSKKDKWKYINYLDTGNLTENQISEVQYLVVGEDTIPSRAKRKVEPGDIVYSTVRPNHKHYGILRKPPKNLLVSTGFVTIRAKKEADTNFIYWFLVQPQIIEKLQIIGEHSTSAYPSIKPSDIEGLKLKLPGITEQKTIAHILGSLDDKIELNRRMNETLEAMAQALFKSWFVDFDPVIDNALAAGNEIPEELKERADIREALSDARKPLPEEIQNLFPSEFEHTEEMGWIPKGWKVSTVGEEVEIVGGGTPSTKDESYWTLGMHAFCTPKDMSTLPTKILLNTERLLTDKGVAKVSSGQLPSGTVLMSSRAPIGYLAIADVPVTVNQGIIAMVKQERFSELFLLCWASCNMDKIMARANGSTFLEISKKNFRPIPFLLPEDDIRKAFNRQTDTITKRLITCTRNMKELSAIRDTLLPQLLSGEMRIPEGEKLVEGLQ
jgi:type I restriction enzyme S subunit